MGGAVSAPDVIDKGPVEAEVINMLKIAEVNKKMSLPVLSEIVTEDDTFVIEIVRKGSLPFGLIVCPDDSPNELVVESITDDGLLGEWNRENNNLLERGDKIISVCGFTGDSDSLLQRIHATKDGEVLRMVVRVPNNVSFDERAGLEKSVSFDVIVQCTPGEPNMLGLLVSMDDHPSYLTVDEVASDPTESLVSKWNAA